MTEHTAPPPGEDSRRALPSGADGTPSGGTRRAWFRGLAGLAWGGLVAAAGLGLGAVLRMFSAGAGTSDLSRPVVVTPPADWPPGLVISQGPVALARDQAGVYALLLVCPHLGCRPSWQAGQRLFVCPCHGSRFRADGSLARGPAARGLSHLTVETDAQNRLVVLPGRPAPAGARVAI